MSFWKIISVLQENSLILCKMNDVISSVVKQYYCMERWHFIRSVLIAIIGGFSFFAYSAGRSCGALEIHIIQTEDPASEIEPGTMSVDSIYFPKDVDVMAEFHGGVNACMEFLYKNYRIPHPHSCYQPQGRIVVRFIVGKDGAVSDAKVIQSLEPDEDAEVLRAVNLMPRWIPASIDGKPVRSYFYLPITFRLADGDSIVDN